MRWRHFSRISTPIAVFDGILAARFTCLLRRGGRAACRADPRTVLAHCQAMRQRSLTTGSGRTATIGSRDAWLHSRWKGRERHAVQRGCDPGPGKPVGPSCDTQTLARADARIGMGCSSLRGGSRKSPGANGLGRWSPRAPKITDSGSRPLVWDIGPRLPDGPGLGASRRPDANGLAQRP